MFPKFHGLGVAMVTPFKKNLQVDYEALVKVFNHIQTGADYVVVQGTTGESVTITKAEKKKILETVKTNNHKKIPIVYGIGGNDTKKVLEEINETNLEGVDAILSVCPYYNKPGKRGVITHFKEIADASPVPIFLYNIPSRTGINLTSDAVAELSQHPNIIGIKEASCIIEQCMEIHRDCPKDFLLISGDDVQSLPIIALGGVGVMSVVGNAYPIEFGEVIHTCLKGDFKTASNLISKFLRIDPLLYEEGNPVGVKKILEIRGIIKSYVRPPLYAATKDLEKRQIEVLKRDGFSI